MAQDVLITVERRRRRPGAASLLAAVAMVLTMGLAVPPAPDSTAEPTAGVTAGATAEPTAAAPESSSALPQGPEDPTEGVDDPANAEAAAPEVGEAAEATGPPAQLPAEDPAADGVVTPSVLPTDEPVPDGGAAPTPGSAPGAGAAMADATDGAGAGATESAVGVPLPATAATLTGRVVDALTGEPVVGVTVTAAGRSFRTATTDRDGRYTIGPVVEGDYYIMSKEDDVSFYPATQLEDPVWVSAGSTAEAPDIRSERGGRISGTISAPMPTFVFFSAWSPDLDHGGNTSARVVDDGPVDWTLVVPAGSYTITVDSELPDLYWPDAPGSGNVIEVAAGSVSAGHDIRLPAAASISGRVTDENGRPVRAGVSANGSSTRTYKGTLTDADGRYRIAGLPADSYEISLTTAGDQQYYYRDARLWSDATRVELGPGADLTGIDHVVDLGRVVAGTVTSVSGEPAVGIDVVLRRADDLDYLTKTSTVAGGAFTFDAVEPGAYVVEVGPPYGQGRLQYFGGEVPELARTVVVTADGDQQDDLKITLLPGSTVSGAVRGADGTAVDASVRLIPVVAGSTFLDSYGTRTDASGEFVLRELPPATYTLRVEPAPGEGVPVERTVTVGAVGPEHLGGIEVTVVPGHVVTGSAVVRPGAYVDLVVLRDAGTGEEVATSTVILDRFAFDDVPSGRYVLETHVVDGDLRQIFYYDGTGNRGEATVIELAGEPSVRDLEDVLVAGPGTTAPGGGRPGWPPVVDVGDPGTPAGAPAGTPAASPAAVLTGPPAAVLTGTPVTAPVWRASSGSQLPQTGVDPVTLLVGMVVLLLAGGAAVTRTRAPQRHAVPGARWPRGGSEVPE